VQPFLFWGGETEKAIVDPMKEPKKTALGEWQTEEQISMMKYTIVYRIRFAHRLVMCKR
jgi:hypothetical protein